MAKRKRLTPANPMFLDTPPEAPAPLRAAPIAEVAREAATTAAAEELARTLTEAREQGRMVIAVPLDAIVLDHLVRDRVAVDADEMAALKSSLMARGQQTPVELVAIGEDRFGLISGWRRCMALQALRSETGDPRFDTVLALLRQPQDAAEAYQAMVEENEIRASLSHYERARIVSKAVEQGVFASDRTALQTLFEAASRARRSKIGSFLSVVAELDGCLRFPEALTERLGLQLSRGFDEDDSLGPRLRGALRKERPETPEDELALVERVLAGAPLSARPLPEAGTDDAEDAEATRPGFTPDPPPAVQPPAPRRVQVVTGIALLEDRDGRLVLEGNRVDAGLKARLIEWLRGQG